MESMDELQKVQLNERLTALRNEGDRLRAERLAREHAARARATTQAGPAVAGGRAGDHPPARVRLGHWLIGIGSAVAGHDHHEGAAGRAA
jgi:hypothetical protein